MVSWWDRDMRQQGNRTMLGWGIPSQKFQQSRPRERLDRRGRAWRDRRLAEMVEGIPQWHDQDYRFGPFSRASLRRRDGLPWLDFYRSRRRTR